MKLQFDANQEYQLDAIKATVDLFAGQLVRVSNFAFEKAARVGGAYRQCCCLACAGGRAAGIAGRVLFVHLPGKSESKGGNFAKVACREAARFLYCGIEMRV